ncbi:hypothetical protein IHE55_15935 [Streptomyces pactum]|uniref:Integral membrane protein n=1 Tax=Streptomyces pactum TaxID=68249 RepID=A0ABS0NM05_9ACTN|nr:hypothetical protein [Streptomyces pactum]MBH5336196.1 hypothetical protein [Streptomyces pactum]
MARARALAVLRIRGTALAVALLPAAVAVVLLAGGAAGRAGDPGTAVWDVVFWAVTGIAVAALLTAAAVALVVSRARPALSPTVPIPEDAAPELYRLVRELAERLGVPAPSAIALTPDCDSWLEDRSHRAHRGRTGRYGDPGPGAGRTGRGSASRAPVLVIGSPFLWWMRVAELRALLAPVVAGTGPSAHPDIAAARRFVRGLDAAVAETSRDRPSGGGAPAGGPRRGAGFLRGARRPADAVIGRIAGLLLRGCRQHAAEMERAVAAAASERARNVDYGLRIVAQEQVGLAYAGWDRLLTRVALPAWRMGRWPSRLDAGVVAALTELSRRDRLAEGFASRLGERPACDLLDEPGLIDEAASLLAARLFHGGPPEPGPQWAPVGWDDYPQQVVDRKWRLEAARLLRALDALSHDVLRPDGFPGGLGAAGPPAGTLATGGLAAESRSAHGTAPGGPPGHGLPPAAAAGASGVTAATGATGATGGGTRPDVPARDGIRRAGPPAGAPHGAGAPVPGADAVGRGTPGDAHPTLSRVMDRLSLGAPGGRDLGEELAALLTAELAREEAGRRTSAEPGRDGGPAAAAAHGPGAGDGDGPAGAWSEPWADGFAPLVPLQPPRTGRELLADHVAAMVCCAAVDTAGATPGLDWLDGPVLLVGGRRAADLAVPVLSLVEDGDAAPLRAWLGEAGVRSEKPVRLA